MVSNGLGSGKMGLVGGRMAIHDVSVHCLTRLREARKNDWFHDGPPI